MINRLLKIWKVSNAINTNKFMIMISKSFASSEIKRSNTSKTHSNSGSLSNVVKCSGWTGKCPRDIFIFGIVCTEVSERLSVWRVGMWTRMLLGPENTSQVTVEPAAGQKTEVNQTKGWWGWGGNSLVYSSSNDTFLNFSIENRAWAPCRTDRWEMTGWMFTGDDTWN